MLDVDHLRRRQRSHGGAPNPVRVKLGSVSAIHRYPVKALRAETLAATAVLEDGLEGDRTCALVVTSAGHPRSGQTYRGKEHPRLHTLGDSRDAVGAAAGAGVTAVLDDDARRYFDVHPISLLFDTWLGDLEAVIGYAVEPLRFRPNFVVRAEPEFAGREDDLVGMRLRIGGCALAVVKAIERCVTPSYDLATGERDKTLARALAVDRGNRMGIYCTVATPGRVALGDAVLRA
jgi:uncharacterized protein YcbX